MPDHGTDGVTRLELVSLHKAIQRHCVCRGLDPAVLEEACPAHRMLRDDAAVQRWVLARRNAQAYVSAEFMVQKTGL
jgi:hypothetical protein